MRLLLGYFARSSNGRTDGSEPSNRGSNPCWAADLYKTQTNGMIFTSSNDFVTIIANFTLSGSIQGWIINGVLSKESK